MNRSSAGSGASDACSSSSHPNGCPQWASIWRASVSPIGRELFTWLHMLAEISSLAAKSWSNPFAGKPAAMACSRNLRCSAMALDRLVIVMFDTKKTQVKKRLCGQLTLK